MHSDLELIVSADEEARARVALEEQRRQREVTAARTEHDAAIGARRKEASDALEREIQAIRDDGDRRVAVLQRQQEEYLASLAAAGERKFDEAVAVYQRIVCGGSP
jgi:hypothetical protein